MSSIPALFQVKAKVKREACPLQNQHRTPLSIKVDGLIQELSKGKVQELSKTFKSNFESFQQCGKSYLTNLKGIKKESGFLVGVEAFFKRLGRRFIPGAVGLGIGGSWVPEKVTESYKETKVLGETFKYITEHRTPGYLKLSELGEFGVAVLILEGVGALVEGIAKGVGHREGKWDKALKKANSELLSWTKKCGKSWQGLKKGVRQVCDQYVRGLHGVGVLKEWGICCYRTEKSAIDGVALVRLDNGSLLARVEKNNGPELELNEKRPDDRIASFATQVVELNVLSGLIEHEKTNKTDMVFAALIGLFRQAHDGLKDDFKKVEDGQLPHYKKNLSPIGYQCAQKHLSLVKNVWAQYSEKGYSSEKIKQLEDKEREIMEKNKRTYSLPLFKQRNAKWAKKAFDELESSKGK